ncbi:uncharacterized protein LOC141621975 [Silene latifolia]|uniref:uncharacterized protein LOC141621975 n=1 Tax=Silene latifolia TaxID=37657 RepID=UPI003D770DC6
MAQPESTYPSTFSEWNAAFLSYENVISSNSDELKLEATIKLGGQLHRAPKHLLLLTVPILVRILEDLPGASGPLQEAAACCLKRVICDNEDHELATLVCEPRTVASLVSILSRSDGRCQKYLIKCLWGAACNALGVISSHVDFIRPVAEAGVIPLYAELLRGTEQLGWEIAEDVFCVLAVVEANAVEIVQHLVRILREDNAEARAAAADVLWDLSSYKHSISVIHNSGAIPILVQLLGDQNTDVRENVSGAIAQLSYRGVNRSALADAGAIPCLIEMLQDESEELRDNAGESLMNFAEDPIHHERLSEAFAMPAFQNMQERMVHIRAADHHMVRSLRHMSIEQLTRDPVLD